MPETLTPQPDLNQRVTESIARFISERPSFGEGIFNITCQIMQLLGAEPEKYLVLWRDQHPDEYAALHHNMFEAMKNFPPKLKESLTSEKLGSPQKS
jgi:hypothetical protein